MNEIWPRVQDIFRDVFDDPQLNIGPETTANDVPGWDSLSTINLVAALESEFKIRFALGEIQELSNVGAMIELIQKKMGQPGRR